MKYQGIVCRRGIGSPLTAIAMAMALISSARAEFVICPTAATTNSRVCGYSPSYGWGDLGAYSNTSTSDSGGSCSGGDLGPVDSPIDDGSSNGGLSGVGPADPGSVDNSPSFDPGNPSYDGAGPSNLWDNFSQEYTQNEQLAWSDYNLTNPPFGVLHNGSEPVFVEPSNSPDISSPNFGGTGFGSFGSDFGGSFDSGSASDGGISSFGGGGDFGGLFGGDPVNFNSGNKYEQVWDYRSLGPFPLIFGRTYNSLTPVVSGSKNSLGANWSGTYDFTLNTSGSEVFIHRPDGKIIGFAQNGSGQWISEDINAASQLTASTDGAGNVLAWQHTLPNKSIETYDAQGRLIKITNRYGLSQTLQYDSVTGLLSGVTDPFGRRLQFVYDVGARLIRVTTPTGASIAYTYDTNNNLTSATTADGRKISYLYENPTFVHALTGKVDNAGVRFASFTYDSNGLVSSTEGAAGIGHLSISYQQNATVVTDVFGVVRTHQFATIGHMNQTTGVTMSCADCESNLARSISYDGNGYVSAITDYSGRTVAYQYDGNGLLQSKTVAASTSQAQTTHYTWDPVLRLPKRVDLFNNTSISFSYDALGNLLTKTFTAGGVSRTWTYSYNSFGQITRIVGPDPSGKEVTTYGYDPQGNMTSVTDALGHTVQYPEHDGNGRVLTAVAPNGLITRYTYDAAGRRTSKTVGAATTQYGYDLNGQMSGVQWPTGRVVTFRHDASHLLSDIVDAKGYDLHITRDLGARVTQRSVLDPSGAVIALHTSGYDSRGRLIQSGDASGNATSYSYDPDANLLTITDALHRTASVSYDSLVRPATVVDARNGVTSIEYDVNGAVASVTDPRGVKTTYQRDGFVQTTAVGSPDAGSHQFVYDSVGNLVQVTDARNQTTQYRYDVLRRLTSITYADKSQESFSYDVGANAQGLLSGFKDSTGHTAYSYDSYRRISSMTEDVGNFHASVGYVYQPSGLPSQVTYPSGHAITYDYDNAGRLQAVEVDHRNLISNVRIGPGGRISGWNWNNGLVHSRVFDQDGRLSLISRAHGTLTFAYDPVWHIANQWYSDAANESSAYTYDDLDDLTSTSSTSLSRSYAYDGNGNRTQDQSGTVVNNYVYAIDSNRLKEIAQKFLGVFTYDDNGSLTWDAFQNYVYDARGRLVQASSANATTTYLINALGQRVAKRSRPRFFGGLDDLNSEWDDHPDCDNRHFDCWNGWIGERYFVYDTANRLLGEYAQDGRAIQEYVWLGARPVAILRGTGNRVRAYQIHSDHLGTPRQVTDDTGKVVWEWRSGPYGEGMPNEDPDGDGRKFVLNLRMPGQYYDKETGLFHNGLRDYNPQLGRYVQSDPIGIAGGLNPYRYVDNSPMSLYDPEGLAPNFLGCYSSCMNTLGGNTALQGIIPFNIGSNAPYGSPKLSIDPVTGEISGVVTKWSPGFSTIFQMSPKIGTAILGLSKASGAAAAACAGWTAGTSLGCMASCSANPSNY